jgi:hypothetical protein
MSKRRERQQHRMPLEEKVRLAMVDLFRDCGPVTVEAHDHDDIQGLAVMVNPPILSVLRAEDLSQLLAKARVLMLQLMPPRIIDFTNGPLALIREIFILEAPRIGNFRSLH